jgi:hypothetical protein
VKNRLRLTRSGLVLLAILLGLGVAHGLAAWPREPFYNNDETSHLLTGIFFRDLLLDWPLGGLRDYTIRYYQQYPSLSLLVWPPLVYFLEGLFMLVLGPTLLAGKIVIGLFAALGVTYLFFLVRRTHDLFTAGLAAAVFGLSPLIFFMSRYVMLEIPTLALVLAAVHHFLRYLELDRRRDLVLATLWAAGAALTRFDAAFLVVLLAALALIRRRPGVFIRKEVIGCALLALILVAPVYYLSARQIGWIHLAAVRGGGALGNAGLFSPEQLFYYPSYLPEQIGWFGAAAAAAGLLAGLLPGRRAATWPYLAMAAVVYFTFTPIAERDSRHVIYWIPAFSLLAAQGVGALPGWIVSGGRTAAALRGALAASLLLGTGWATSRDSRPFLEGYREAARLVVSGSRSGRFCLFDGWLAGDFIYQVRRLDPARRLWVLRGDQIFYNENPYSGYRELAKNEEGILATIFRYDPEFVVVEEPRIGWTVAPRMALELRAVLRNHPERFRRESSIPLETNREAFQGVKLEVWRSLVRNEHPDPNLEIWVPGLRRSLGTPGPRKDQPPR